MEDIKHRNLNKNTIKPIIKFLGGWGNSIYSLNTEGAKYYSFTLDTYKAKNSWQGGFGWFLDDALKYEMYAIEIATGDVYNQNKEIVMNVKE